MALETAMYQYQDPFGQIIADINNNNNNDAIDDAEKFDLLYPFHPQNWASSFSSSLDITADYWQNNYDYKYPSLNAVDFQDYEQGRPNSKSERPKRRRKGRTKKKEEEIEKQRMTHIAVERNRRKQINHYLSLLRSLMPPSYVLRGDQASIIGGAINFVKELEQKLQCLSAKKQMNQKANGSISDSDSVSSFPFGEFFSSPPHNGTVTAGGAKGLRSGDVDVEVTLVESHALVKIRSKPPPKLLSKLVHGFQAMSLTILHLNVSNVNGVALHSFSLKAEDAKMSSVEEIERAVYELVGRIQEEALSYF